MAKYQITSPEGETFEITAPDNASHEQVLSYAQSQFKASKQPSNTGASAPTDNAIKPSAPSGLLRGIKDPIDGAAQLLYHALPESVRDAGDQLNNWIADKTGLVAKIPEKNLSGLITGQNSGLDGLIQKDERSYQAGRQAAGEDGIDWSRLAGNIVSPVNAVAAVAAPVRAAGVAGRVIQGARAGAVGSAMAPVHDGVDNYWAEKGIQAGAGAVGGAVLTPIVGKVADSIVRRAAVNPAEVAKQADDILREGVNRMRREGIDVTPSHIQQLRQQVVTSLSEGKQIDPAALMRRADFEALGMNPTLGQITRDANQFARERNLRGVAGVGEPLMNRFDQQAQRMQQLLGQRADGAMDEFNAGQKMMDALKGVDDAAAAKVSAAYNKARDHVGRAAPMDSSFFSQSANLVLDEQMLGSSLPVEARKIMNDVTLGKIPLNVNSAVLIDRRLSELQRDATRQGRGSAATAIGAVRDSLNKTPIADNVGEDAKAAFDAARGMARDRFKMHELIPALKASADGDMSADDFVRRFLINGKSEDVIGLAKVMPQDAMQEARRQIGAVLQRAAYSENAGGDKAFASDRFAATLRRLGKDKLGAFFSPDEISEFERISRVGAYINSTPAGSPVNTSNTAAAVMNLMSRIPGVPAGVGLLQSAKNAAANHMTVNAAMKAEPSITNSALTPSQQALVSRLLGIGAVGAGGSAASGVGN